MLNDAVATILSAITATFVTIFITMRFTLNDSLDTKSGWRKELFKVAGSENPSLDDVQMIRAAVRYTKHDENDVVPFSFRWMTNQIIYLCDDYFPTRVQNEKCMNRCFGKKDAETIRILARYLLKVHWESRSNIFAVNSFRDSMNIKDNEPRLIELETLKLILEKNDMIKIKVEVKGSSSDKQLSKDDLQSIIFQIKDEKKSKAKRIKIAGGILLASVCILLLLHLLWNLNITGSFPNCASIVVSPILEILIVVAIVWLFVEYLDVVARC